MRSSWIRDQTRVSCLGRQILYHWATREAPSHSFYIPLLLGFCREIEWTHTYGGLLWGIDLCDFRGLEVPQSAFCKLKTRKSQWCNSVQVRSPENQGSYWYKSWSNGRKRWDVSVQEMGQKKGGGADSCFLCLTFCSVHILGWWDHVHIAVGHLLKCHILIYANLSTKHSHRHTQKCLVWAAMAGQIDTQKNSITFML